MGNENKKDSYIKNSNNKIQYGNNIEIINRNSFQILTLIGVGGFSKVWEVKWKKNGLPFAMKEISKARILDRKSEKLIIFERDILSKLKHPFIINLHFSFQDQNSLYLIMDLVKGEDLRKHLSIKKQMNEEQTKFITGCIILGLEYLHFNLIVHRDIKPENIILDENGYAKITDFGLSTHVSELNTKSTPGTFSYMAPEVLFHEQSNFELDYYSLGILVYELMNGIRPYMEVNAANTRKYLSENQFSMKRYAVPEGWGIESADFINRLLQKNPKIRLGSSGIKEVKNHCWFRGFNFDDLYKFKIKSPVEITHTYKPIRIKPIAKDVYKRYNKIMKSNEYKTAFKSFLYFNIYDKNLCKDFLSNPHENSNGNKNINNNIINNDNLKQSKNVGNKSFNININNNDGLINYRSSLNLSVNPDLLNKQKNHI